MSTSSQISKAVHAKASPKGAQARAIFFKTGEGEYSEGDIFLGVTVPDIRTAVKEYLKTAKLRDAYPLLKSKYHEDRLAGAILMTELFARAKSVEERKEIYQAYLAYSSRINNWDIVDVSAPRIVGMYLLDKKRAILHKLAKSDILWERRIAVVATWAFIRSRDPRDTFKIAEALLKDKEDLTHKAVGWMLREVGKSCGLPVLNEFLDTHAPKMPRTMLRYAIERHSETARKKYLKMGK